MEIMMVKVIMVMVAGETKNGNNDGNVAEKLNKIIKKNI